jgi:hypothetical protein
MVNTEKLRRRGNGGKSLYEFLSNPVNSDKKPSKKINIQFDFLFF